MLKRFLIIFLLPFVFISCDEKDADHHDDEHFEPTRMVFMLNGEEYLEINNGQVTNTHNSNFTLNVNEVIGTFDLIFYDEDGDVLEFEDDHYNISWELDDEGIVMFRKVDNVETNYSITALSSGNTNVTFFINHGDHADITFPKIPIVVN